MQGTPLSVFFLLCSISQACGVNSIAFGVISISLGVNSKGYGDRTHPFKKAYSYSQKELAIPILSLNPTIKLNEEKPHKQRIMQKFDKPVKEYHKISEEFPAFHLFGKRGTLLH